MHAYMCNRCVSSVFRGRKRVLSPLQLIIVTECCEPPHDSWVPNLSLLQVLLRVAIIYLAP